MSTLEYIHTPRSAKESRIDVRMPNRLKVLIEHAADLKGISVTDFVLECAEREAVETINEHSIIELTARDSQLFAEAVLNPREPSDYLRAALAEYEEDTISVD